MATSNKANAMKMVDGWFHFSLLRLEVISSSTQPRETGDVNMHWRLVTSLLAPGAAKTSGTALKPYRCDHSVTTRSHPFLREAASRKLTINHQEGSSEEDTDLDSLLLLRQGLAEDPLEDTSELIALLAGEAMPSIDAIEECSGFAGAH